MGNVKQGESSLQAKGNPKKCEVINEYCSMVNQNNLIIYHQNIRDIINKTEELLLSFTLELPHIICLSEHHIKEHEINMVPLNEYILASQYSRKNFRQGGVCIFIKKNI
jgi:hypothetical protein